MKRILERQNSNSLSQEKLKLNQGLLRRLRILIQVRVFYPESKGKLKILFHFNLGSTSCGPAVESFHSQINRKRRLENIDNENERIYRQLKDQ